MGLQLNNSPNTTTMKDLIASINDMVSSVKPVADQCKWMSITPKNLQTLELEELVGLCEWQQIEPRVSYNVFETTINFDSLYLHVSTAQIPELIGRKEPSVLDLIKSIIAERKAQQAAA